MAAGGEEHRQPEQHQQGQVLAEHALPPFRTRLAGHDELVAFVEHVTTKMSNEPMVKNAGTWRRLRVADHHDRDDRLVLVDHRDLRPGPAGWSTTPP